MIFALIVPLSGDGGLAPSHPIAPGGQPPYPSQGPGFPTHPIHLPPLPPGTVLPPNVVGTPEHPIYLPPYPSTGPGFPTQLPMPGGPPVGVWPPLNPAYPAHPIAPGGDTHPAHPIVIPGTPTHPIASPPGQVWPPLTDLHTKSWTLAWLPGYGHRWITVEPPLPDQGLPSAPLRPDNPNAAPKGASRV